MRYFIWMLFLLFISGCVYEKPKENVTTEDENAALVFKELDLILKQEGGKLWNYSLQSPLMLVDRQSRKIYANQEDKEGYLQKQGDIYTGTLPENVNIANTAIDWNGKRWTMVALPLPNDKHDRMDLLIHESFHCLQPEIGFDSMHQLSNNYLDTKAGRIYLKMELEALKDALQAGEPEKHIKNALAFRSYRHQLFPEAKDAENLLELNEGLAEYTGSILSGRSDRELKKHYANSIDTFYNNPSFVRSFPYYSIPIYGYFMKREKEHWNLDINKKTNLSDYINSFYGFDPKMITGQEILATGELYGLDSIAAYEEKREVKKLARIESYRKRFLADSVMVLPLQNMQIGFNPSNLVPLDSHGTVYPNMRITDNWGILEVDSGGALLAPRWNKVTLEYPSFISDTLIRGYGWVLKPDSGWKPTEEKGLMVLKKVHDY